MRLVHNSAQLIVAGLLSLAPSASAFGANGLLATFKQPSNGMFPSAPLAFDSQGRFYGTTVQGGTNAERCERTNGCGVVYMLTPDVLGQYAFSVIYRFTGTPDGASPMGGVLLDSAGNLYGTTEFGGVRGAGAIYELSPGPSGAWTETILYSFQGYGKDGAFPQGNLVMDSSGNLYGTTSAGGFQDAGTAFRLSPQASGGWTETELYSFLSSANDGYSPVAGVVLDTVGNLYGTTALGGESGGYGTVFELSPSSAGSWVETQLYLFQGSGDGCRPTAGLTFDSSGNLFGTTIACGGTGHAGTVFELSPSASGWTENTIHRFDTSNGDGFSPAAPVVFDSSENLYGTTVLGGAYGQGAVYKLQFNGGVWRESGVHQFTGKDGASPRSGMVFGLDGSLYGTTYSGGSAQLGVVYAVNP